MTLKEFGKDYAREVGRNYVRKFRFIFWLLVFVVTVAGLNKVFNLRLTDDEIIAYGCLCYIIVWIAQKVRWAYSDN